MNFFGFKREDLRLTYSFFKMMLRDRYLGSSLGVIWAVVHPLLLLGIYTFVFGFILKQRLPGSEKNLSYAIWLICGFVPYLSIPDAFNSTAQSVIQGAAMVKNMVFKSEILPMASVLVAMVPVAVGFCFLMVILLLSGSWPSWHLMALCFLIPIHILFLTGVGFFLSATAVFVRDTLQVLSTVTLLISFFTPIFYSAELLPRLVRPLTYLNPFYWLCQPYRDILLYHRLPNMLGVLYLGILASFLFWAGLKYFRRLKGYFEMKL